MSLALSTADLRARGEVENSRVRAKGNALRGTVRKAFIAAIEAESKFVSKKIDRLEVLTVCLGIAEVLQLCRKEEFLDFKLSISVTAVRHVY